MNPRFAIVGCGAVGSFYGAKLCRAGHDVHFLLRSDYEAVRRDGVRVLSIEGDFAVRPRCARQAEDIGPCDLVFVALKTTANDQLPSLIPPLLGAATAVVSLQNGLGDEEQLAAVAGEDRVLGGLCFVCLNRIAAGTIRHTAHGQIVLGEHGRPPMARTHAIAGWLRAAGIPCTITEDLARAHWEKLVWNVPFNGLGVAGAAGLAALESGRLPPDPIPLESIPTDRLLADPRWEEWVRALMHEVIATARALGHEIDPFFADDQMEKTRCMGAYKASTLLDFEHGLPLELESLFLVPLRHASARGIPTPRLAALCRVLEQLEARRQQRTGSPDRWKQSATSERNSRVGRMPGRGA